jgi:hypothetical protein
MLMLHFLSQSHSFFNLVKVYLLISSLIKNGSLSSLLLLFRYPYHLHLLLWSLRLPNLILLCKFIDNLEIGALLLIAPLLHLLCLRFLLLDTDYLPIVLRRGLYLYSNTLLLFFCHIIVFNLVYVPLLYHVLYLHSLIL